MSRKVTKNLAEIRQNGSRYYVNAVSRNEQAEHLCPQPLYAGKRCGPPGPGQIAEKAEDTGEILEEKPVTLAINEVAAGKLDATSMDLRINEEDTSITA